MKVPCELLINTDSYPGKKGLDQRQYFAFIYNNCVCCFFRGQSIQLNFGKIIACQGELHGNSLQAGVQHRMREFLRNLEQMACSETPSIVD